MDIENNGLSKNEGQKMQIQEFINEYKNHPILFVGSGFSQRYLDNSFTWSALLNHIASIAYDDEETYLELIYQEQKNCPEGKNYLDKIGGILETQFDQKLAADRNGELKHINDQFFERLKAHPSFPISRLKLYISSLLGKLEYRSIASVNKEINILKQARKNIGSVITTNYDCLIEDIFKFNPLVGNNILLSNPYGSVYKIHGCVTSPSDIILTDADYEKFNGKYELIRAQLLSLFIHNPIIFIGYSISDDNIKTLLKTIFTYVDENSEEAEKIRKNFLLVEFEKGSKSTLVVEHDIVLDSTKTIRINKIKTDNYKAIYEKISELELPVSAMDVRKVQNVFKEIISGGTVKVRITEDIDDLENNDKVLAIGSTDTIKYHFKNLSELISTYFTILEEKNHQLIKLLEQQQITSSQYIPIFGFSKICPDLKIAARFKDLIERRLTTKFSGSPKNPAKVALAKSRNKEVKKYESIYAVYNDSAIATSYKTDFMFRGIWQSLFDLEEVEQFLKEPFHNRKHSDYRLLLCAYDYKKYNP